MVKVQQATFIPTDTGGEIQANMQVGSQEVTTKWPISNQDDDLGPLLDHLMVKVQKITFVSTPNGGEIRADMTLGDRVFVSRWPVEEDDHELKPTLDRLLDEISRKCIANLLSELDRETTLGTPREH